MASYLIIAGLLAFLPHQSFALPQAGLGVFAPPSCIDGDAQINYVINKQTIKSGDGQTGDYTVKGGESLSQSSTFSVGVTVTKGVDVSIAQIAGAGLSYSVSTTTTKATTQGGTLECPEGPWYCALLVYPEMLEVEGRMEKKHDDIEPCKKVPQDFTAEYPVEGDSGGIRSRLEICSCGNFEHWADEGAPTLHCADCASPL